MESLTTAARLTRARPMVRAAAVAAVRRGDRRALSVASRPGTLYTRRMGQPRTVATGRVTTGLSRYTPMKVARAPPPTAVRIDLVAMSTVIPMARAPVPAAVTAVPTMSRRRSPVGVRRTSSRRAATGGMRRTRRDGPMADSRVAPMPTTAATTMVRTRTGMAPGSSPKPMATSTQRSSEARRKPPTRPSTVATTPTTTASRRTDRLT